MLDDPHPPLRLVLGNDAHDLVRDRLQAAQQEPAAREKLGRNVEFEDG